MSYTNEIKQVSQDVFLFLLSFAQRGKSGELLWNTCPIGDYHRGQDALGIPRDTRTACADILREENMVVYRVDERVNILVVPNREVVGVYALTNKIYTYLESAESVNKGDFADVINGCGLDSSLITIEGSDGLYKVRDVCDISGEHVSVNLNNWDSVSKCGQRGNVVYILE